MRLGSELNYNFSVPTPMIVMLNVHYSRASDLEHPDHLRVDPSIPVWSYRDVFGNWCCRLVAPVGPFSVGTDTVIRDSGEPDAMDPYAIQHPVEDLPPEALQYLLGSRYCETDLLMDEAWRLFGHTAPDASRVQAIVDFVHNHIRFNYNDARNTRTASEAYAEGRGVCRDFTHLAVAFCRCMNIPTKYCTGYISDVGLPPPYATMDFAAWMEVYLGGRWHVFDPRNNQPRRGRVLVAQGRDAADVPLTHTFGSNRLTGFKVWIDEIKE
jgi:transglutaminase-like putative cysteine protease